MTTKHYGVPEGMVGSRRGERMFPQEEGLKPYAVGLYQRDGVPAACLLLQERAGVDVNVLLMAVWMAACKDRALDEADARRARLRVVDWHQEVVRPLRAVRRRLKQGPHPAPSDETHRLRAELQKLEISAELIELDQLEMLAEEMPERESAGTLRDNAMAGMLAVVAAFASRPADEQERDAMGTIVAAATGPTS
ncbi:TIGR02444 family protein [Chelatococcus sp. GCM10030263]|uniref:TIGR02444 family protein n=1 Tax=Chelatococcus sp. GCM10030263 TaxID=3273387 RepID=UPI0036121A18